MSNRFVFKKDSEGFQFEIPQVALATGITVGLAYGILKVIGKTMALIKFGFD